MKKTSKKKWIQDMDMDEGAFTRQAKRAKKTVAQFREEVLDNPKKYAKTTVKRANLAKTFSKMKKKK
jgi:hypothetical protein